MIYPTLNCYPSSYPELSKQLVAFFIDASGEWVPPCNIYPFFLADGEFRARNELRNLCQQGILRKDARGYQLARPVEEARAIFAYKETATQRLMMAEILHKGFVYARQFQLAGKADATQFLRAARALVAQGVIQSDLVPAPRVGHIKRRIYTFTEKAKRNG